MLHKPVLLSEVLKSATDASIEILRILDGTFGRGGHTSAMLETFPKARVFAMDRDQQAIDYGNTQFQSEIQAKRLTLVHGNFAEIDSFDLHGFDFALLDLGVSSPQLDTPERGFSFYKEGPLDMRMDQREPISARDIINTWSEEDLNELFKVYGEVRNPYRVTRAICEDRETQSFETTLDIAKLIERVCGWKRRGQHPATQYFLALRIKVNHEFDAVEQGVEKVIERLNPGGRLAVITFHSAEDRIVKYAFRRLAETQGKLVNKKVIIPTREEELENPRSRSAKLRVFERGNHE